MQPLAESPDVNSQRTRSIAIEDERRCVAYESRSIDGQCPNLQLLCVAPVTDVLPTLRQRAISVKQSPHVAGRRIAAELPINVNDHSFQVNSVAERAPANVTSGIFDIQTSVVSFARLPTRTPPSARRSWFWAQRGQWCPARRGQSNRVSAWPRAAETR